jgi:hypothetical protein
MPKVSNTSVTIDGTSYAVPVMKFKTLKKAFPVVSKLEASDDLIEMTEAAFEVVSLALRQDPANEHMTTEWISDNIDIDESIALAETIQGMLVDSGLITKADGEVALSGEAEGAAPSTETSTPSSQSLSQQGVAEEIGTL